MPIRSPSFHVEQLSPAEVFAQFEQPEQEPGMIDQILRGIFNRRRPRGTSMASEEEPEELPSITDITLEALFGSYGLDVPEAQGVIGPAAPPVTPPPRSRIKDVIR